MTAPTRAVDSIAASEWPPALVVSCFFVHNGMRSALPDSWNTGSDPELTEEELSRMIRHMPSRAPVPIALILLAALAAGCDDGDAPPRFETTAYQELNRAFQPLREDFEGEAGRVRLVAVATPTCGYCIVSMESIFTELLPRLGTEDFVVLALWAGIMPTDTGPRAARAAEMFQDDRFHHYFDSSGRIARVFGRLMGLDPGLSVTGAFLLYGPDDTWDPHATMMDEPEGHNALLAGWLPGEPHFIMGEHSGVSMPAFDLNAMEQQIMILLSDQ